MFVAGDIARINMGWSVDGTCSEGKHVHREGAASNIVGRAPQTNDGGG